MYRSLLSTLSVSLLVPSALSMGLAFCPGALAQQPAELQTVGEPTQAEIATAYAARIADINERARKLLGDDDAAVMLLTFEDAKKLGCRGMDRIGIHFDCRVQLRLRQGERRAKTDVVDLWLSHEDGAWVLH